MTNLRLGFEAAPPSFEVVVLQKFLGAALVFFVRTPLVNPPDLFLYPGRAGVEQSLLEIVQEHGAGCLIRLQLFVNEITNNVVQELPVRPPYRTDGRCRGHACFASSPSLACGHGCDRACFASSPSLACGRTCDHACFASSPGGGSSSSQGAGSSCDTQVCCKWACGANVTQVCCTRACGANARVVRDCVVSNVLRWRNVRGGT